MTMQFGDKSNGSDNNTNNNNNTIKCLVPRSNRASIMGFLESACRNMLVSDEHGIACIELSYEKSNANDAESTKNKTAVSSASVTSRDAASCRKKSKTRKSHRKSNIECDGVSPNSNNILDHEKLSREPFLTVATTEKEQEAKTTCSENGEIVGRVNVKACAGTDENSGNTGITCEADSKLETDKETYEKDNNNNDPTPKNENEKKIIEATFTMTYIDLKTLEISKQHSYHAIKYLEKFRLNMYLSCGVLCAVWVRHNQCISWNFNNALLSRHYFSDTTTTAKKESSLSTPVTTTNINGNRSKSDTKNDPKITISENITASEADTPTPLHFYTDENLEDAFNINLNEDGYLVVSSKDEDFLDSVFSSDDASLRMTSYYSCTDKEIRFNSKSVIGQILELDPLVHVSDILFLDIPANPKWMVLEWSLPEMTLSQIYFYKIEKSVSTGNDNNSNANYVYNDNGKLVRDGVINFKNDFTPAEYDICFGQINQLQSKVVVSRGRDEGVSVKVAEGDSSKWRAFIWVSWNHVIIANLENYDIVGILRPGDLTRFKDFKNELHDFQLELTTTKVGVKYHERVMLYVQKNGKDIVHFCRFNLSQ